MSPSTLCYIFCLCVHLLSVIYFVYVPTYSLLYILSMCHLLSVIYFVYVSTYSLLYILSMSPPTGCHTHPAIIYLQDCRRSTDILRTAIINYTFQQTLKVAWSLVRCVVCPYFESLISSDPPCKLTMPVLQYYP